MGSYGPPQSPDPEATPGIRERESIAPVTSSLVDVGIAEEDIDVILGPYLSESVGVGGPAIALFHLESNDPDPQRITELVNAATVGAAEERLIVSRVNVTYGIADCASLLREARAQTIADAREQASVQAELLDMTVGDVRSAHDLSYGPESVYGYYGPLPAATGCVPFEVPNTALLSYRAPSFEPNAEAEVAVHAQVEITFNVTQDSDATT